MAVILAAQASHDAAYKCRNCRTEPAAPGRAFCQGCANIIQAECERAAPRTLSTALATAEASRRLCRACGQPISADALVQFHMSCCPPAAGAAPYEVGSSLPLRLVR
jgi:hypothetical protein